jgi:DNA modification methylase
VTKTTRQKGLDNVALKVEQWPIDRPKPYARNARKISDAAISKVAASLSEFGWRQPIVVDEAGVIIAGHTRLLAAKKLGMTEVPVHVAVGLTPEQVKAYRLMDNRSHEEAEWDLALLAPEIADLQALAVDLSLTGFDEDEITRFLADAGATEGLTDPDAVPDTPEAPVSVSGDLWLMGRHRLLCGDSTVATDVDRLLGGVKPHLMVTDPPYGVSYDPSWRDVAGMAGHGPKWKNKGTGLVSNDDKADWREAWALFPGSIAYVWHGGLHSSVVAESLTACKFTLRAQIIWAKQHFVFGRGDYHWQHEPCWYAVRGTGNWAGDRKQTTLWQIKNLNPMGGETSEKASGHGTQKPVECMRRPIENNSSPGQAVYEPFCGSGTTIIAAEQTGRSCLALELSPAYCDVIVNRWQDFTGLKATLDGDGRTFDEIASERFLIKLGAQAALKEEAELAAQ